MALQRKLREKGARVSVDGSFGPATRAAVRALQRKLGMRATGIATVSFLRKLGLRTLPGAPAVAVTGAASPAPTGSGVYLKAFPVGGDAYSYSNDFGAPRHQGAHEGNDIICTEEPTPILSATYGQIQRLTRVETGLGGIWIWIVDPQGNEYYYAHLSEIAAGLQEGSEVWPGRVIGECGNTGDARYGVQHLHFEVHPGGGAATNPYTDLQAVDPKLKGGSGSTTKTQSSVPVITGL